jgi:hypothetical protein
MEQLRTVSNPKQNIQEKVQILLTEESEKFSTAMENVIGACYEAASQPKNQKEAKMNALIKKFKKDFNSTDTVHKGPDQVKNCLAFGEKIIKALPGKGDGKFAVQKSGTITAFWKDKGGRNSTSKTDIVIGGYQCSVKNADGAQLMSAKSGESIATAEAAAVEINGTKNPIPAKTLNGITAAMDELAQFTSEGYYASMDNLRALKEKGHSGTLISYLEKKEKDIKKDMEKWKDSGGAKKDKPKDLTATEKKILANKEKASEYKTILKGENAEFMKKVDGIFKQNQDKVKKLLLKSFDTNGDYKLAFVHEAATGKRKFGTDTVQYADNLLSWRKKANIADFDVDVKTVAKRNSPLIKKYAGQINLQVNWKSSSTAKHDGYNLYQNVRVGIESAQNKVEKLEESYHNKIHEYQIQLNEGLITEFALWDKIKDLAQKFWSKVKGIWESIINWMRKVFTKIIEFASEGIDAFSKALGFEIETNEPLEGVNLKL